MECMEDNPLSPFFEKHSPRWNQGQPLDNFAVFLGKKLYSHNVFIHREYKLVTPNLEEKQTNAFGGGGTLIP